jgi:hypothetical protein
MATPPTARPFIIDLSISLSFSLPAQSRSQPTVQFSLDCKAQGCDELLPQENVACGALAAGLVRDAAGAANDDALHIDWTHASQQRLQFAA